MIKPDAVAVLFGFNEYGKKFFDRLRLSKEESGAIEENFNNAIEAYSDIANQLREIAKSDEKEVKIAMVMALCDVLKDKEES